MKALYDLKDLLEKEITKVTNKGDISPTEIKTIGEAVDVIKDIETIFTMKEYGNNDQSYAMSNRGYSTRRMSNSYPMYGDSYNSSYNSYDDMSYRQGGNSNARYSRHSEKEEMIDRLERKLKNAQTEQERRYIMECIEELERN